MTEGVLRYRLVQKRERQMSQFTTVATGLRFPEGPVAMPDGSVILVEIAAGRITRVKPGRIDRDGGRAGRRAERAGNGAGRQALLLQQWRLHLCRARRAADPAWPARRLFRRADRADRSCDRAPSRRSTGTAISAACCAGRTTWCSTRMAVSGSPIMARTARASGTSPASSTRMPMAAIWRRSCSPARTRTAWAYRPTAPRSMRRKPIPAG